MTAVGQARALREQARLARTEARLAVAQALVARMRVYAAAASVYDTLASMHESAAGSLPAVVGEQRQRLARQHHNDGRDCRWQAGRTLAHLSMRAQQTGPSRQAAGILDTRSPDWAAPWVELEALAQQLAVTGHAPEPDTVAMLEQLSHREVEVLRYLPSVLTAGEIGAELCVTVNTVKAHLRSIYRKLGVTRRRDAVVRAHQYGILQGPFSPDENPGA
jgi:ATP/maltotriose-dependent transcriptional regulator MalT